MYPVKNTYIVSCDIYVSWDRIRSEVQMHVQVAGFSPDRTPGLGYIIGL